MHRLGAGGVVDAVTQEDLNLFAQALYRAHAQGKRFLLRSAAGIISALAQLPPQPVAPELMSSYVQGTLPGVVIVGSHVQLSTRQVQHLLQQEHVRGIELEITQLLQGKTPLEVVQMAVELITSTPHQKVRYSGFFHPLRNVHPAGVGRQLGRR